jgi:GR25 family glycosyltransferase involved in LPS biosynthesis
MSPTPRPRAQRAGASKKAALKPETACCKEWDAFPERNRTWRWHVVHRFAHSRTTFSDNTLATTAWISTDEARQLITDAVNFRWITPTEQAGIYVGRLTAWRK